jgi:deoxycytidylate deaminase
MSFRMAEKQAKKSTFKQHRLGAVLVKGGRVLSTGYNKYGYTKELRYSTVHAEESSIVRLIKTGRLVDCMGADLYVSRITPGGRIGLAKPCPRCLDLCRSVHVNRVWFSTEDGTMGTIKL